MSTLFKLALPLVLIVFFMVTAYDFFHSSTALVSDVQSEMAKYAKEQELKSKEVHHLSGMVEDKVLVKGGSYSTTDFMYSGTRGGMIPITSSRTSPDRYKIKVNGNELSLSKIEWNALHVEDKVTVTYNGLNEVTDLTISG